MKKVLNIARIIFVTVSFILLLTSFVGIYLVPGGPNMTMLGVSIVLGWISIILLVEW